MNLMDEYLRAWAASAGLGAVALGLPDALLDRVGGVAVANVRIDSPERGLFEWGGDEGTEAYIVAAWSRPWLKDDYARFPLYPDSVRSAPEPTDLVAFTADGRAWCRIGAAGSHAAVLGWKNGSAVRLFETPLTWLRGGAQGACIVDLGGMTFREWAMLEGIETVECGDEAFATVVYRALRAKAKLPKIPDVVVSA